MTETELSEWIGRRDTQTDVVTPSRVAAWHAALDRARPLPNAGDAVAPGFHWALFPPLTATSALGDDGHPPTGGFLPPVALPRRMWAGSRVTVHRPLRVGQAVTRESTVAAVAEKQGRAGPLVFVTVRHSIADTNGSVLDEEQDLVYRGAPSAQPGETPPPPDASSDRPHAWRDVVAPSAALLFRYSAVTFNAHRIHYDRRYAESVEGYPGLVVHAPLVATLLLGLAERHAPDVTIERYAFRAVRPTFDVASFAVCGAPGDDAGHVRLWSTSHAGEIAVEADAWTR